MRCGMKHVLFHILQVFAVLLALLIVLLFVFAIVGHLSWLRFFLAAALFSFIAYFVLPRVRAILEK